VTFGFRPSTPVDLASIATLCTRVLATPEQSPVFSREHMQWKYWDPRPNWPGSRSFMLFKHDPFSKRPTILPSPARDSGSTA